MSMFYCDVCAELKDSDDGCDNAPGSHIKLRCIDCMIEAEDDEEEPTP